MITFFSSSNVAYLLDQMSVMIRFAPPRPILSHIALIYNRLCNFMNLIGIVYLICINYLEA